MPIEEYGTQRLVARVFAVGLARTVPPLPPPPPPPSGRARSRYVWMVNSCEIGEDFIISGVTFKRDSHSSAACLRCGHSFSAARRNISMQQMTGHADSHVRGDEAADPSAPSQPPPPRPASGSCDEGGIGIFEVNTARCVPARPRQRGRTPGVGRGRGQRWRRLERAPAPKQNWQRQTRLFQESSC